MSKEVKLPSGKTVGWKQIEYPSLYANIMGFSMTPFDISIIFGEVGDTTDTHVLGTPKMKLLLSPEQASNLMKLLGVALQAYTNANGALRLTGAINLEELNKQVAEQNPKVQ